MQGSRMEPWWLAIWRSNSSRLLSSHCYFFFFWFPRGVDRNVLDPVGSPFLLMWALIISRKPESTGLYGEYQFQGLNMNLYIEFWLFPACNESRHPSPKLLLREPVYNKRILISRLESTIDMWLIQIVCVVVPSKVDLSPAIVQDVKVITPHFY